MKFIVGLGNPGPKYYLTRHNIGFLALDHLLSETSSSYKEKWKSLYAKTNILSQEVILQKPQTYMNLSGDAVIQSLNFFKGSPQDLIVIQDDIALPFGSLRFQKNRSAGGHNGIKDITKKLSTQDYTRLKVGVGLPSSSMPVDQYVLNDFSKEEQKELPFLLNDIEAAVKTYITDGLDRAANKHNRK